MGSFLRNARLSLFANAITNILSFLSITIIARNLPADQYALYATFVATALITIQIMDFGFSVSIINKKAELDQFGNFNRAISAIFLVRLIYCAVVSVVIFIVGAEIEENIFSSAVGMLSPLHLLPLLAILNTMLNVQSMNISKAKN